MNFKKYIIGLLLSSVASLSVATAQDSPRWMRYPAISPDGKTIAFCYQGDIYSVPTEGGTATRLTTNPAYDYMPVWSPDGQKIAFSSNRNDGAYDIYVMSARGGVAKRITTHSTTETPLFFSPDGKFIYYTAHIQDPASSALYPSSALNELYRVPVDGGRTTLELATPLAAGVMSRDGKTLVYEDVKGFENTWRKHQVNSVARDIIKYDFQSGKYTPLLTWEGEDRNPVLSADGSTIYFLSERSGSFNVYSADSHGQNVKQLTNFHKHPVRFLTGAQDGTLAFGFDGELYTLKPGAQPRKVRVSIFNDTELAQVRDLRLPGGVTSAALSPDGKQVAFIIRGEVFVTSTDYNTTRRITNTPAEENSVTFADNRTLVYASKRNGRSDLFVAKIERNEEANFPNATVIREELLMPNVKGEKMLPSFAPNGKDLAFVLDRSKLMVYNIETKAIRQITDGKYQNERTGYMDFVWSPDSKWLALSLVMNNHEPYSDIAIVSATESNGEIHNLTQSGYFAMNPRFVMGGNAIIYSSEEYGMRNHASWGSMSDVMIVFLNREAYNKFRLSKEDFELLSDAEKKAKEEEEKINKDKKDDKSTDKKGDDDVKVEFDNIHRRILRLTPSSSNLGDAYVTDDGKKLYYFAAFEGGYDLWTTDLRKGDTELLSKLDGPSFSMIPDAEGKSLLLASSRQMKTMNLSTEKLTNVSYNAEMKLRPFEERAFMFEEVRREEGDRFYVKDMHGVDWAALTDHYEGYLPHISNNQDFSEMLSELLGELNVSHTGSGYHAPNTADKTAELGLFLDFSPDRRGVRVDEVIIGGPFDVYSSKVKAGDYVVAIDGERITEDMDFFPLLAGKAGKPTLVTFANNSGEWSENIKPISSGALSKLLYTRWVEQRAAEVDKLSNGKLGYVHISSMNDGSFRKAYSDLLGKYYQREGVVVDIRYNGGGRLHEDIEVLLSGTKYLTQEIQGKYYCDMPSRRWTKPSVMVTCEMDYSNAHGTPWVYQHMGIGKIVGMPVPGTMTSVNWVTLQDPSLFFGIPAVGYRTADGYYLENHQVEPDIKAPLDFTKALTGSDTQMEAAVRELMK